MITISWWLMMCVGQCGLHDKADYVPFDSLAECQARIEARPGDLLYCKPMYFNVDAAHRNGDSPDRATLGEAQADEPTAETEAKP